ncbi:hypothetical protein EGW08_015611 [Elysia chlorotica]|uniref:Alpha-amylase n=1 Tax=Elysia chlorotica TaxID=188477 RepID=A0A3S0ZK46_ELYCH|nr:hypothetical protein EGW08_015611 [Elysia chlorotica]
MWVCALLLFGIITREGMLLYLSPPPLIKGLSSQYDPYHDPHCGGRQVIVHLFEWKWTDIAAECERYLGSKGFCGVQVSPANEHRVIVQGGDRPWWERYQPVSYKLVSRSGDEAQFQDMVNRCRKVGVRIYVDVVLNHMAGLGQSGTGTAGSEFNSDQRSFPGVPFGPNDFHTRSDCPSASGDVDNFQDSENVRNCNLLGLVDINGGTDYVRGKQADFLNHLIDLGVAGFRCDASKHIWPGDMAGIQSKVKDLPEGGRPFFYHEVSDFNNEAIQGSEYFGEGYVTEFRYSVKVKDGVDNLDQLLYVYDQGWNMSPSKHAFVYVDNHDTQRNGGVLTYKDGARYKRAQAFTLAYNYGFTRVMSSYYFNSNDQGPPHNGDLSTKDVTINADGSCGNGWVCEHRWKPIGNMARFRNFVSSTDHVDNWNTANGVLSFNRANLGFFAMGSNNFNEQRQTGMPAGSYCDLISDCKIKVNVDGGGNAQISPADGDDPFVAIISQQGYFNSTIKFRPLGQRAEW